MFKSKPFPINENPMIPHRSLYALFYSVAGQKQDVKARMWYKLFIINR